MKPSIPKGTRDFSPIEMVRRNHILEIIKTVYQRYGFQQIETPAMENLSTLEGKYGDEGDKLLFRILNSGPVLEKLQTSNSRPQYSDLTEKGLRYDLTVPFARYVVMHQNEITFPFKRYQIQPVWRADRPQKGRYREFYQCDADVIGSDSLLNEVEMIQMIDEVYKTLGIPVIIKFNNRKILNGLVECAGIPLSRINDILFAIDESDKIGIKIALSRLQEKNFSSQQIKNLEEILNELIFHLNKEIIKDKILDKKFDGKTETGLEGINEARFVIEKLSEIYGMNIVYMESVQKRTASQSSWKQRDENKTLYFHFDLSLARGLNYYTGAIFEVKVDSTRGNSTFTSSLLGGGRYDDLTGIFGLPNVSGVGISFGVDRIYDVMEELNLFPFHEFANETTRVLFLNFGGEEEKKCLELLSKTRSSEINAEIYPDPVIHPKHIKKQFSYANAKNIPYVIIFGADEKSKESFKIKNLGTRNEYLFELNEFDKILEKIKERSII